MKESTEAIVRAEYLRRYDVATKGVRQAFGVTVPNYADVRREIALDLAIAGKGV